MKLNKRNILKTLQIILGMMILSFGLTYIHSPNDISEGGVLGSILLINHWTNIDMGLISFTLDLICYAIAYKYFGLKFIIKSLFTSLLLSSFLTLWSKIPLQLTALSQSYILAAIVAGLCVGVGVGIAMRAGVSSGGDDALAMVIAKNFKIKLSQAYMLTDFSVLILSLSYIPITKIFYSLITVTVSSISIDKIVHYKLKKQS